VRLHPQRHVSRAETGRALLLRVPLAGPAAVWGMNRIRCGVVGVGLLRIQGLAAHVTTSSLIRQQVSVGVKLDSIPREHVRRRRDPQPGNIGIVVKFPQSRGKALRNELQAWPGPIEDR
jgi:hypothetical protein